jgi:hypothetical protein
MRIEVNELWEKPNQSIHNVNASANKRVAAHSLMLCCVKAKEEKEREIEKYIRARRSGRDSVCRSAAQRRLSCGRYWRYFSILFEKFCGRGEEFPCLLKPRCLSAA